MLIKKQIDTLLMPIFKYFLMLFYVLVTCFSIAAVFIFMGLKYHKPLLIILGPLLSMAPIILISLKKNLVAKKAIILFSEDSIEITMPDTLNERFIYSDIKYFSVSKYASDNSSTIKFILRNGIKKRYIFFRQLDNDENILNSVLLYFSSYNIGKIQEEKIQVLPSFYGTKQGRLFVAATGILILFFIIVQVIYTPKTIPISLIAVLVGYLQAKGIQMNDREILRKFRDGN